MRYVTKQLPENVFCNVANKETCNDKRMIQKIQQEAQQSLTGMEGNANYAIHQYGRGVATTKACVKTSVKARFGFYVMSSFEQNDRAMHECWEFST